MRTYVATLHGVNRTQYPIYASTVIGSVTALSSDVIMRGIDLAEQRGGGNINLLAMHHSVRRAYIALTDTSRRYTAGDLSSPDAGTDAARGRNLTFGGIELEVDKYANYGTMYGLDTSTLVRFVEVPGEWINEDGAILRPVGSGTTLQTSGKRRTESGRTSITNTRISPSGWTALPRPYRGPYRVMRHA